MKYLSNVLAVLIILAAFALLTSTLFRFSDVPFDSDEATHALDGAQLAADIYHGDFRAFAEHVYFVHWYPPLLPAYLAPFFLALKPAFWSARFPMILLYLVYLALSYRVSKCLARSSLAGLIAMLLASTSSSLWLHSILCMEEMLALVGVQLVVYAFARRSSYWIGVWMAFTLLSKLSIGIYVAGGVFVALALGTESLKMKLHRGVRIFAPLLIVMALWWAHPAKISDFANYLAASTPAYDRLGWGDLGYYWQAVLTRYSLTPLIGALMLVALVIAVTHWRDERARLPVAIVLTTWVVLLIERQLNPRFFLTAISALFLLSGYVVARDGRLLLQRLRSRDLGWVFAMVAIALVITAAISVGASVMSFPFLAEVAYEVSADSTAIHSWISDVVPRGRAIFLVNGWDRFSTPAFNFYLCAQRWPNWHRPTVFDVLLVDAEQHPEAVTEFQESLFAASPSYVVHLDNTPVPEAGSWWAYRAAMEPCAPDDWQVSKVFFFRVWDSQLPREVLEHPFRYAAIDNRAWARDAKRYILRIPIHGATCDPPEPDLSD